MIPQIPHVPAIDWGLHENIEKGRDVTRRPFSVSASLARRNAELQILAKPSFEGCRYGEGICPLVYRQPAHLVYLQFTLYILVKSQGKEETIMEAIREYNNVEAISVMHWEGIDFEFLEPEIKFVRARTRPAREKQRPHVTAKQKRLMEAERFTHALP